MLPSTISVASENSVSTLITPSDLPRLILLTYDGPNSPHSMNKYEPYHGRVKRGYLSRKNDGKICHENMRFYCSMCSDKEK